MARPKQPYCTKCLLNGKEVLKRKGQPYCTKHTKEYRKSYYWRTGK